MHYLLIIESIHALFADYAELFSFKSCCFCLFNMTFLSPANCVYWWVYFF